MITRVTLLLCSVAIGAVVLAQYRQPYYSGGGPAYYPPERPTSPNLPLWDYGRRQPSGNMPLPDAIGRSRCRQVPYNVSPNGYVCS